MSTPQADTFQQLIPLRWLKFAVSVLLLSGVFSLIIVFARTPGLYNIPYVKKLFHEALVVHVDLLVLGWPLCIAAMMWAVFCPSKLSLAGKTTINILASWLIGFGVLGLIVSPLDMAAEPLKNNYIPVITSDIFTYGLMLIGVGAFILAAHAVFANQRHDYKDLSLAAVCNWGARGAGIIVLFSLVALYLGFKNTSPADIGAEHYYESAFWAGGHIFQFAFTQLQMIAWLWVFCRLVPPAEKGGHVQHFAGGAVIRAIFLLNTLIAAVGMVGILSFDTLSFEYNQFYTMHMIIGAGIAPTLMLIYMACNYFRRPRVAAPYLKSALLVSIALFLYGGILGLLIQGQDVTIPAHYHGSTISVTIALMGFAYAYVSTISTAPIPSRLMKWQPIIYGVGQFMHITGLAVSGGYGVLRKTPGLEDGLSKAKIAMGFMGAGGLLAMIGGLLFVYIMWRCLRRQSS